MTTAAQTQIGTASRLFLRIAETVMLAYGWRRRMIACAAGACGALALEPVGFLPAMLIPMTIAVWLLDGEGALRIGRRVSLLGAFGTGWWWGFGYFLAGLWWLGAAFLVEADKFAWALPLGVIGLPTCLAFFPALGFALARLLWSPGPGRVLALAAGLGLSEWLRGHVLTGFPWNAFGMGLADNLVTAQAASLIGLYGLTVLSVALFAAPATLIDRQAEGARSRRVFASPLFVAIACFAGLIAFGALRLAGGPISLVKGVNLRMMQPNLAQDAKFRPENKDEILSHYLSLSDRSTGPSHTGLADVTVLIWPESAFPFILSRDADALSRIEAALSPNSVLVTGAAREEDRPSTPETEGRERAYFFNSVQMVIKSGLLPQSYDKTHLVPFGEYLPFAGMFAKLGITQFVHIPGGFEPGATRALLDVPGLPPAVPLICYEAIFPGEAVPPLARREQPGLMLNVTNDGWFGQTAGPYQHFAQARLRTIEEGLPLVRAANSGISAVIDPYGRVLAQLSLGKEGVIDAGLPERLNPPLFARAQFLAPFLIWICVLMGAFIFRKRK